MSRLFLLIDNTINRFVNLGNELLYLLTESVMPEAVSGTPRLLEPDDKVTLMYRNFDNLITRNGVTFQETGIFNITVVTTRISKIEGVLEHGAEEKIHTKQTGS